uniref:Uncharacterized protein n=1 Tax=Salix viminalis TaxID=40686 RepID=A0A6N2L8L7_SALVM
MMNLYVTAVPPADLNRNTEWFISLITFSTGRKASHLLKTRIDNGKQLTRNRMFLTAVPVVLHLTASHTTGYQHPMLIFNTLVVIVHVVAKFLNMHEVRIFGINADNFLNVSFMFGFVPSS